MTLWVQNVIPSIDISDKACHLVRMTQSTTTMQGLNERQDAILTAAYKAFATYGFRRTSMDDIARGAGLSRTALYLHYRSKEDIFVRLVQHYFDQAESDMTTALARPGQTVEQALMAAFIAKDGMLMETVLTTPHGAELLEAGLTAAGDLSATGEARLAAVLSRWFTGQDLPAQLGTPAELADTVMAALKGLKVTAKDIATYRAGEARLARLIARALD